MIKTRPHYKERPTGKECLDAWYDTGSLQKAASLLSKKYQSSTGTSISYQTIRRWAMEYVLENPDECRGLFDYPDDNAWKEFLDHTRKQLNV